MEIEVATASAANLAAYAEVPIAFTVRSRYRVQVIDRGLGGLRLVEELVDPPWCKDYDALPDGGPVAWGEHWDLTSWGILVAADEGRRVGGATVAWNTDGVNMLEGRDDLAVLWDLRVSPDRRGEGTGTRLFRAAADWSRNRGCRELKVETQDINVPACRFYARQGCVLGGIDTRAYRPALPGETMFLWYLAL